LLKVSMNQLGTRARKPLRRLGLALLASGASAAEVMDELAVSRVTVWKWKCALEAGERCDGGGAAAAPPAPVLAAPAPVTRQKLATLIGQGARPYGFADGRWTMTRLTLMVEKEFGLCLSPLETFRLLGDLLPQPGNGSLCEAPADAAPQRQ
jgi:transposase